MVSGAPKQKAPRWSLVLFGNHESGVDTCPFASCSSNLASVGACIATATFLADDREQALGSGGPTSAHRVPLQIAQAGEK